MGTSQYLLDKVDRLRVEGRLGTKGRYVERDSLEAGLARRPREWHWPSCHHFRKSSSGMVSADTRARHGFFRIPGNYLRNNPGHEENHRVGVPKSMLIPGPCAAITTRCPSPRGVTPW
jgi:hypothetical protein